MNSVSVYAGDRLADYNFGADHPFGPARQHAFLSHLAQLGLAGRCRLVEPVKAAREDIARFHTAEYIDRVRQASEHGGGYLDYGDTPAFPGVYEAAAYVAGTVLQAVADLMTAKEEKELADMISGISEDRTSEELQELRDLREKAKAGARVSRELAGTETQRSEAEFLEFATQAASDNEFDRLIGLTKEAAEPKAEEPADRTKLPES